MREVEPQVYLAATPHVENNGLLNYFEDISAGSWADRILDGDNDFGTAEDLVEVAGRVCYKSWEPGLNPNVRRTRKNQRSYLENIVSSYHGSVLEHAQYTFVFSNVSRVFTHELARHRHASISQESMRFVRVDDVPIWLPERVRDDAEYCQKARELVHHVEEFQRWATEHFGLDDEAMPFTEKKELTSLNRRFHLEGTATALVWSANVRSLRHIIEVRTSPAAEAEMRLVFSRVAEIMSDELPAVFGDYVVTEDGAWVPGYRKV